MGNMQKPGGLQSGQSLGVTTEEDLHELEICAPHLRQPLGSKRARRVNGSSRGKFFPPGLFVCQHTVAHTLTYREHDKFL